MLMLAFGLRAQDGSCSLSLAVPSMGQISEMQREARRQLTCARETSASNSNCLVGDKAEESVMVSLLFLAGISAIPTIYLPTNCRAEQAQYSPSLKVYEGCMTDEQAAHDKVVKRWAQVPADVRARCADMGSITGSYIEIDVVDVEMLEILNAPPRIRPASKQ